MEINNKFLNETLKEWAVEFIVNRIAEVRAAKLIQSEDLINSYQSQLIRATSAGVASIIFGFNEYARYYDMRRLNRRKKSFGREGMKELKQWILDEGVEKFRSGFFSKRGKLPTTDIRLANDIAWGIVRSKKRKHRRRLRYSNNRERDIDRLYDTLLEGYGTTTLKQLKNQIKNGNTQG